MIAFSNSWRQSRIVSCTVQIEQSADNLYAHVALDGIDVGPGDEVLVHEAPHRVDFGASIQCRCVATVRRAGPIKRAWTRLKACVELAELYEVGFIPRRPS